MRHYRYLIVTAILALTATLAITSLVGDSMTFDEPSHITSGYSYLKTGDFRLGPDNPPLTQMWLALPLLFVDNVWQAGPNTPGWLRGNQWLVGLFWLFELNDGEKLLLYPRLMMVVLLLVTCLCIYITTKKIFGPRAALLALVLSALSPTLLAHGRLATTDLPFTLMVLLTLPAFSKLFERITILRCLLAFIALTASSLTKFSWPTILPALAIMALVSILGKKPIPVALFSKQLKPGQTTQLSSIKSKVSAMIVIFILSAVAVWAGIWSAFGWRYSPFIGPDAKIATMRTVCKPMPETMDKVWQRTLSNDKAEPIKGVVPTFIRKARAGRWLPEAYLYGMAFIWRSISYSNCYLMGQVSTKGWSLYMPIAFLIKTPVAVIVLLVFGILTLLKRGTTIIKDPTLFTGIVCFAVFYTSSAIVTKYSIGHRHIVPVYPALFIIASASVLYPGQFIKRFVVAACVIWLAAANLWIYPHYLCYFNELIAGPSRGHLFLAESNIDWGQDLKRLAKYAKKHPDEVIKLAYFGSSNPTKYGFKCENLHSTGYFEPVAALTGGTYVISITQLLGVFDPGVTDTFWENPPNQKLYEKTLKEISNINEQKTSQKIYDALYKRKEYLTRARLLNRLRKRLPDERIGYSLFVYRLTDEEVQERIRP